MPRIPESRLREILIEAFAGVPGVRLPESLERTTEITIPVGPTTARTFDIAFRTVTRDTRHAGVWQPRLKIQLTSLESVRKLDAILGVAIVGGDVVFVSIDPAIHIPTRGRSNNVQFHEDLLFNVATTQCEAAYTKRSSQEVVRAFPVSELVPFLLALGGRATSISAPPTTKALKPAAYTFSRRRVRDPSFAQRIKTLFRQECAVCKVSLGLAEAAHIVPHALSGDDSEANGLCLCPSHHTAFDIADLITFSSDRRIWVNRSKLEYLRSQSLLGGFALALQETGDALTGVGVDQSEKLGSRFELDQGASDWAPRDKALLRPRLIMSLKAPKRPRRAAASEKPSAARLRRATDAD